MPPKKGTKRKAAKATATDTNGDDSLAPPDRNTWPGWVEMESEPAFFNVMLKEMGVRGVKIQELLGLDEAMMSFVPRPVHALIFLFRYKDAEMTQTETECPKEVWFANQIPDFACASVALLNIVNNIEDLQMGKEMRDFKDFTQDLDPMGRGDAVDGFDFLKHIHNSFARETDLLNADVHMRNKANRAAKRQAIAKAKATKAAKLAEDTPKAKREETAISTPSRTSKRMTKPTAKKMKESRTEIPESGASSPLSDPPESDPEFTNAARAKKNTSSPPEKATRRSGRQPKPRKNLNLPSSEAEVNPDAEGFHYVAYLPINNRVWKLDGLDSYPHMVGEFDAALGGDWMNIAVPEIQARMMQFEDGDIQFSIMAVVHDPMVSARTDLAANIKELQTIDTKLDSVAGEKDWKSKEGADPHPCDTITGPSDQLDLFAFDIASAPQPTALEKQILVQEDAFINELIKLRQQRVNAQAPLRASVRDQLESSKADDEKARMRRHDFGGFVRGWLGALAEEEVLKGLVDEEA